MSVKSESKEVVHTTTDTKTFLRLVSRHERLNERYTRYDLVISLDDLHLLFGIDKVDFLNHEGEPRPGCKANCVRISGYDVPLWDDGKSVKLSDILNYFAKVNVAAGAAKAKCEIRTMLGCKS